LLIIVDGEENEYNSYSKASIKMMSMFLYGQFHDRYSHRDSSSSSLLSSSSSRKQRSSPSKLSNAISILAFAGLIVVLTTVVIWRDDQKRQYRALKLASSLSLSSPELTTPSSNSRYLLEDITSNSDNNDKKTDDDDTNRSAICKEYLRNFLNGTTDAKDQCQAFYNAYKAAKCADETHAILPTIPDHRDLGYSSSSSTPSFFVFGELNTDSNIQKKKDNNKTDDDVVIDDFFENWECCDSIQSSYEKNCETAEGIQSIQLLGIMSVLLVCTMLKASMKAYNVHWIPDACAFILIGTFVGIVLRLLDNSLVSKLTFDGDLFLQIMLPPIIFQAALSIDKRAFRRDLFPILSFAGVGTAFSSLAIGWIVHQVSHWGRNGINLPLLDSLVFGALISSIDPVATLGILSGVGVSQTDTLYTLIFGESLLNDGVAIVLFDTLRDHLGEDDGLTPEAYREMTKSFFFVLLGSMAIGLIAGMLCTLYFSLLRGKQTAVTEVGSFFIFALIPYYIADGLKCSGIISTMVMGFMMDYYVVGGFQSEESAWNDYMVMRGSETGDGIHRPVIPPDRWTEIQNGLCKAFSGRGHILARSRQSVGFFAQVIASIMDTAIFAYLGLFLFNDNVWSFRLNVTAILSCVSSRLVMVIALSLFINIAVFFDIENRIVRCCRSFQRINLADDDDSTGSHTKMYLDTKTQLLLFLSGIRGAVSFALVESIPVWDNVTKEGSKFKAELKTMTSSSIVFTLFVFGALTFVAVKHGSNEAVAGSGLTHRLLSEPLDSGDEATEADPEGSYAPDSSLEIEHHTNNGGFAPGAGAQMLGSNNHTQNHAMTLAERNDNDPDERYRGSNEWISS
jgi:NhaP-type Na+/H+ or K+/H+ antiporter